MAQVELIMPKMGESIIEATILKWVKQVGDTVDVDETILEIATDKVDSEVPSPVAGTISQILFQEDDVVEVGKVIAIIATEGSSTAVASSPAVENEPVKEATPAPAKSAPVTEKVSVPAVAATPIDTSDSNRFYSPLVKNIAAKENISLQELESIAGSGEKGRVTKKDILAYVANRGNVQQTTSPAPSTVPSPSVTEAPKVATSVSGDVEVIEMDRMRKMIADHMVMSKSTSPHVTSFVEVDVTNIVNWRNGIKADFQAKFGEKITFTPIFVEAIAKAIHDYPLINVSVDGTNIVRKKDINVGMAAALPSGNLIVPVIKNADHLSLLGLTKAVNDLANRARANKLKPEEIQGGTFTLTNVGTFGNVMGTPIINQPQVAILAAGAIRKKPAVVETEYGDMIVPRHMMFLSLSYDHRVVDGALGGSFLRKIGDYLEQFDGNRKI
jgi:2-oxoglutarate dehydrogenase E2 component (dihydrolipoamide succinyltransferase)